ncbi:MAG: DUF4190 domain-containing protein [Bradymonadaceae bacterium]
MLPNIRFLLSFAAAFFGALYGAQAHQQPPYQHGPPPPTGSSSQSAGNLAIATLICGIGAWTILPGVAAPIAIIMGFIELGKIKKGESPEAGRMFAKIGMWLGIAQIILGFVAGCVLVAFYLGLMGIIFGAAAASA